MAFQRFEAGETGWKKLDAIILKIQNAINKRAPKAGFGIEIAEDPNGAIIHLPEPGGSGGDGDVASGSGGESIALYGARNGAPALFHLLQSSAPTAAP